MKFLLATLFIMTAATAFAQHSLRGHVFDGQTNTSLPGASVFIAKTTFGVMTDVNGSFEIGNLRPVHYQLVVSFIGYETQVIDLVPSENKTYKIIMKPAPKLLPQAVVTSKTSRSDWLANFKIFKERFIGLSDNYKQCTFINSGVLHFRKNEGILKATADSTLIVENRGLGYRIKILLEKYEFNMVTFVVHYEGQINYEKLTPGSPEEEKRWAKNRLKAYYGSEMHFLRALHDRRLNEEGYYFNVVSIQNDGKNGQVKKAIADTVLNPISSITGRKMRMYTITNYDRVLESLSIAEDPDAPLMKFDGDLEVKYIMEAEADDYQRNRKQRFEQVPQFSIIKLRKPATVEQHGQVYPQDAIETSGYWSWELIAESLPLDYEPVDDLKIVNGN